MRPPSWKRLARFTAEASGHLRSLRSAAGRNAFAHMEEVLARRPVGLNLETHSRCNAQCVFCARRKIPQRGDPMPMETFEKICQDYADLGGGLMGFSPILADPLLDPLLLNRIELARKDFPTIRMHAFTNLIGLDRYSDEEVAFLLGSLTHLNVSIGGTTREEYRLMFGVDCFERVRASLDRVGRLRPAGCRVSIHVRTHRPADEVRASALLSDLRAMGFACDDVLNEYASWGGLITQEELPEGASLVPPPLLRLSPCFITKTYLTIVPDGHVLACSCVDSKHTFEVGNVLSESLAEIWTGQRCARARMDSMLGRGLCAGCEYYMPSRALLSNPKLLTYQPQQDIWAAMA